MQLKLRNEVTWQTVNFPFFKDHIVPFLSDSKMAEFQPVLSASTYNGGRCAASLGRLNLAAGSGKAGSWCANRNNVNQWLQIDLGTPTTITKVATQGRQDASQWVTSYSLSYSLAGSYWVQYTVRGKKRVTTFLQ